MNNNLIVTNIYCNNGKYVDRYLSPEDKSDRNRDTVQFEWHKAAFYGNVEMLKMIDYPIENNTNSYGGLSRARSELACTIPLGQLGAFDYLVKKGANINITYDRGETSFYRREWFGHQQLWTPLIEASLYGHFIIVNILLELRRKYPFNSSSVHLNKYDICCALNVAAAVGHNEIITLILTNHYSLIHDVYNTTHCDNSLNVKLINNSLIYAAGAGLCDTVELLLSHGVKINEYSDKGLTALMVAALNNKPKMVKLLIKRGADRNLKSNGSTALMLVTAKLYESYLIREYKFSIDYMIDILSNYNISTLTNNNDIFPKKVSTTNNDWFRAVREANLVHIDILRKKGIDVNIRDNNGKTAYMLALESGSDKLTSFLSKTVERPIDNKNYADKVDYDTEDYDGYTVLMHAIINERIMETLYDLSVSSSCYVSSCDDPSFNDDIMNKYTNIYKRTKQGTILHVLTKIGNYKLLEFFIQNIFSNLFKKYIPIDDTDFKNQTCLMIAVLNCRADIVRLLLEHSADKNIKNLNGHTALDIATELKYRDIIDLLL